MRAAIDDDAVPPLGEPAADLAVAAAVVSSLADEQVPGDMVVFGEIGLGGEVRPVGQREARLREAAKLGFRRALAPKDAEAGQGLAVTGAARLADAIQRIGDGDWD